MNQIAVFGMPLSIFGTKAARGHCSTCRDRHLPYFITVNELQFVPLAERGCPSLLAGSSGMWYIMGPWLGLCQREESALTEAALQGF